MEQSLIPYGDLEKMGNAIAKSGLFGVKTIEQAVALMLIAQAEGKHPATAAMEYHIIQGRPALKADQMLARFQTAGGSVKWIKRTDTEASAEFSHPQGGSLVVTWTIERAKKAELGTRDNWKKYPAQMLSARVVSEGVRAVFPAACGSFYTPEEVGDFDEKKKPAPEVSEPVSVETVIPETAEPAPQPAQPEAPPRLLKTFKQLSDELTQLQLTGTTAELTKWLKENANSLNDLKPADRTKIKPIHAEAKKSIEEREAKNVAA